MRIAMKIFLAVFSVLGIEKADAAINPADLTISVWDPVLKISYTRDLGISTSSFENGSGYQTSQVTTSSGTTETTAFNSGPGNGQKAISLSLASDPNWVSFYNETNPANLLWTITGLPYGGAYALTTGSNFAVASYPGASAAAIEAYQTVVASLAGSASSIIASAAVNGSAYIGNVISANSPGGLGVSNIAAAIGTAQAVSLYLPSSWSTTVTKFTIPSGIPPVTDSTTKVSYGPWFYAFNGANWTLAQNGDLSFVPGAPEPDQYGLMLSGFGLVVFLAKRARKANLANAFH